MSSDNWNTSAEHERIKNRARKREERRKKRAEENPLAFGWERTDDGEYQCMECEETWKTLPGCLEHMHSHTVGEGQTGLGDWA